MHTDERYYWGYLCIDCRQKYWMPHVNKFNALLDKDDTNIVYGYRHGLRKTVGESERLLVNHKNCWWIVKTVGES
mgnify:CR=1 FL=1